jgi:hypothetical protein
MTEKVLYELRVIETEDGIRVEMKGDKERAREMGFGRIMREFGRHAGRGPWGHHGRHWGAWGFFNPWWCDEPEPDEEPKSKPTEA